MVVMYTRKSNMIGASQEKPPAGVIDSVFGGLTKLVDAGKSSVSSTPDTTTGTATNNGNGGTPQRRNSTGGSKGGPGKTRCKRGSRRNKSGDCVRVAGYTAKKRCPKGTRRNKVTGACEQLKGMVKKVAKEALAEVAELKKADVAVASAGVDRLAAARAAAALKRLKKGAAKTARVQGKIAAAEKREKEAERVETMAEKERAELLAKIARSRKAMGIRKNEENPAALRRLIEQWEMEARMRIHNRGPKQVEPSAGA